MMIANTFFTHIIQEPARGSRDSVPADTPTATNSVLMPNEKTNKYRKPNTALCVVDTHVSTAAITGAEHGAATSPDAAPIANVPAYCPPRPAVDARCANPCGTRTGITSTIANAAMISRFAIPKYNHGFVLTVPNNVPLSPANNTSPAYTSANPST